LLARKIAAAEKKQAVQLRLSRLANFSNARPALSGKRGNTMHKNINSKAIVVLASESASILINYELKRELLNHEKAMLESRIKV